MSLLLSDDAMFDNFRNRQGAVLPSTVTDVAAATADAMAKGELLFSRPVALRRYHEEVDEAFRKATGRELDWRRTTRVMAKGTYVDRSAMPRDDAESQRFWAALQQELAENPALAEALPYGTQEELYRAMLSEVAQSQAVREEVVSRAGTGTALLGGLLGGVSAMSTDPLVAGSMLLGAGAGSTILRGALTEAGIAVASELPSRVAATEFLGEAGIEVTAFDNFVALTTAGVGGAGVYAIAATAGKLLRGSEKGALDNAVNNARAAETAPSPPQGSMVQHAARLDRALLDMEAGNAVDVGALPALVANRQLAALDEVAQRISRAEVFGLDLDAAVPGLRRVMESSSILARTGISRRRFEEFIEVAERAAGDEQVALRAAADAEQQYQEALNEALKNRLRLRELEEQAEEGLIPMERSIAALEAKDQRRIRTLDRQIQTADEATAAGARKERLRLIDRGRKRVERGRARAQADIQATQEAAQAAEARLEAAQATRTEAGAAAEQTRAYRDATLRAFAGDIERQLSPKQIKAAYAARAADGEVPDGPMPPGQAAAVGESRIAARSAEELASDPALEAEAEALIARTEEFAEGVPDDIAIDVEGDGVLLTKDEVLRLVSDDYDNATRELEACIRGN